MLDLKKLQKEQEKLAPKVSITDFSKKFETIGGVNVVFDKNIAYCCVVVCNSKDFSIIETKQMKTTVQIGYVPHFLFYREGPIIIETYNLLEQKPDLLLVAGNGILHPHRIGLASHIGILLDCATIGVASKHSFGERIDKTIYVDKEARGYAVQTKQHALPIYVSPGNKISLKTSAEVVKSSIVYPHKLPEPLHLAQKCAKKMRKQE